MSLKEKGKIEQYLNDEELQILDDINEMQEKIHKHKYQKKRLENMSIKDMFNFWIKTNVDILNDLSKMNYNSYDKYFQDIDNTTFWWRGIIMIISSIVKIFTKEKRIIFTGINLIIISVLIYFISSTS